MKRALRFVLVTAAVVLLATVSAHAQSTATGTVNVSAAVNATAKLTLSTNAVAFADADPDTTPSITATGGAIDVSAKAKTASDSEVTLTVLADGPLTSGSDTIAASAITWTVTGGGFAAGTLSDVSATSLGTFTGPGNNSGTQTYFLENSWEYATGNYTLAITYTLTAP